MDIELYGRVIWRHKVVVGIGLVLALVLATLSYVKVSQKGIAYRDSEQWVSYETLSVTQPGFMEGRLNASGADPSRLTLLAVLYSKYVDADPVHRAIWPQGAGDESIEAAPVMAVSGSSSSSALPIISIAAFSPTGRGAQLLAVRTTDALMRYIATRQEQAHVPIGQRVELQPVKRALSNKPLLWQGRSKALPIVIFLTALIAAIGLAFILENLNPQIAAVSDAEEENVRRVIGRPRAS
ncbi:MAG: hypothetical protein HOQ28_07085 [Thermoleophilia bacterium]|nr:hypothetical protein [Thermoleophilia bacterium]